ncbi:hypothetical protein [Streptomyces sp. NPDC050704]|uniref:hypothetical protein n=1 Tax=Streptomyces sp. NPDC050704 TaxID=3157219 RepID=UPI00343ECEC0
MDKKYEGEGEVIGRSTTLFTSAFNEVHCHGHLSRRGVLRRTLSGRAGSFNFVHSKTTLGESPQDGSSSSFRAAERASWQVSQ